MSSHQPSSAGQSHRQRLSLSTSWEVKPEDRYSSDDEESEDDDDESTGILDPNAVLLPEHVAFDEAWPILQARGIACVSSVSGVFDRGDSGSSESLQRMPKGATAAMHAHDTPKRKLFGFVGDTGTGKSATINTPTGIPGLAKSVSLTSITLLAIVLQSIESLQLTDQSQDASGQACTQVVTIYTHRLHFQDPVHRFAAEIRYLDLEKCRKLLSEQLTHYHTFTFGQEDDWTHEDTHEHATLRDQALTMFQSLFCDHIEFKSQTTAEAYLRGDHADPTRPAITKFVVWDGIKNFSMSLWLTALRVVSVRVIPSTT